MRLKYYFIGFLMTLSSFTQLLAQDIKVGIGGGYSYVDNNTYYSSDEGDNYFSSSLGLRNFYIINAKLKYAPLDIPIILTGELNYFSATNDVDYLGYYSFVQSSPAKIHLNASQNIYTLGFGIEAPIIESIITPYFLIGIAANYYGKTKAERTPKLDPFFNRYELAISEKIRAGLNIGFGADYKFLEIMSFDISAKYNFMNMVGKKEISERQNEENFNAFSITASIMYNIKN